MMDLEKSFNVNLGENGKINAFMKKILLWLTDLVAFCSGSMW